MKQQLTHSLIVFALVFGLIQGLSHLAHPKKYFLFYLTLENKSPAEQKKVLTSGGLVGYPNVGKSTLFNALTQTQSAESSNYPFGTIEPNSAKIGIYDTNIQRLTKAAQPHSVSPAQLEIWDIAGLVKGANKGEGLGNQFLGNIRNVNLIINVIRGFKDSNIQYVDRIENIDPINEMDIIKTELILADLDVISRMKLKRDFPNEAVQVYHKIRENLEKGIPARDVFLTETEESYLVGSPLLTRKPVVYLLNIDSESVAKGDNELSLKFKEYMKKQEPDASIVSLCVQAEEEAAVYKNQGKDDKEKEKMFYEYLKEFGLNDTKIKDLTNEGSKKLGLSMFYTAGKKQVASWLIPKGGTAHEAAGKIHTDFQKNFIAGDISKIEDWENYGGTEESLKKHKRWVTRGKEYVMQEGDVALFKHNAR